MFSFSFIGSYIYEPNFLAVHNSSIGIQFRLDGEAIISDEFSNYYLPTECGEKFSRCKDLLVLPNKLNENVTQFVAAIPVTRAVLLLDIRHNGSALILHNFFIVNQTIEDCNPTAIFKIAKSIYTMCFNERTSFLTVIELRIQDLDSVRKVFFARPTIRGGSFDIGNQVSDFLSIGIVNSTDERYVVFTSGNTLTAYAPINTVMPPTYIDIQCSPHRMEHVRGGVVVTYCSDHSVSINIVSQERNGTFYNESGIPFFCPDYPNVKLSAFQSNETYLQYQDLQGSQNITKVIPISISGDGNSLDYGQCFGRGTTYFAYSDNEGIHVVNTTSGREINLSLYGYLNPSVLNVIGGRYLIVQEQAQNGTEAEISVLDSYQNLAEVVRTHSWKADLMAVILTSRSVEPSSSVDIKTILIPIFAVLLAVVVVVLVVVVAACINRR